MIALSTGSLYTFGLARVFDLAAQAGFDAMEILIDERWDTRQADYLQKLSAEYQLSICCLHSPFMPHLPGWSGDPIERVKLTASLARELSVTTVVLHLPPKLGYVQVRGFNRAVTWPTWHSPFKAMRRWMQSEIARFEDDQGVKLCIENMPARTIWGRKYNFCWWNTLAEWPQFRHLTLDTTHLGTWGLDLLVVYQQVRSRVYHIHLSNFNGQEHRRLTDGYLPLAEFLQTLRADQYQGAITVELGPEALDAQDSRRVLAHLQDQVAFCRQHFA